jgi:hypothetical protein
MENIEIDASFIELFLSDYKAVYAHLLHFCEEDKESTREFERELCRYYKYYGNDMNDEQRVNAVERVFQYVRDLGTHKEMARNLLSKLWTDPDITQSIFVNHKDAFFECYNRLEKPYAQLINFEETMVDVFVESILRKQEEKKLKLDIDAALETRDRDRFYELSQTLISIIK